MEKYNNLFITFFLLVMLQLNVAMEEELEKSKTTIHQKKNFFILMKKIMKSK